ncbi:MAG TPA: M28 family metallopeptidase [Vicinamibacteria bacterium]|nr:M28 family metallopeptidase [Vicinamibacteria bacterium]
MRWPWLLLLATHAAAADEPLPGFTNESSVRQRAAEQALLTRPSPDRCRAHHRELTRHPHPAGTPEAQRVADYVAARFRENGLSTEVVSYDVLLSWPRSIAVDLVAPSTARLATREDDIPEDPDSAQAGISGPWHAYAKSGTVEAEVVYVNHGRPQDYDALARLGIEVRGKVALARHFKGYRGGKSLEAEKRGVAALVTYSDPEEDGYVQGDVFPRGPWGPDSHVQRGANVYDFIVPGDPLTPGWASVAGARRTTESESRILPKIPSVPLSFRDARKILEALGGPARPARDWQGGGPFAYHVGPGPARVRLSIDVPRETRTIRNVIARLPGTDPAGRDQVVLLSNHHDAWTFGGVDPSSGTAAALELSRALGELARSGHAPRRTIVFGIWDAEEFTLTGSTEWGEEHAESLATNAVACLNVDSATQGDRLSVGAVPSLRAFAYDAARAVADPKGRGSLYDVWRAAGAGSATGGYGVVAGARTEDPPVLVLGSGSDYTVFLNHLGVPSMDLTFDGPYGVYHSAYDSHAWMSRFGDPDFAYHAAMARLWGVMALRLANADVLPFDYAAYGRDLLVYVDEVARLAKDRGLAVDLAAARTAAQSLASVAPPTPGGDAARANRALMQAERDLLSAEGIPDRPWFRHLVYAPLPSYEAETLPGVREAVVAGDAARAQAQVDLLARAIERAVATLRAR